MKNNWRNNMTETIKKIAYRGMMGNSREACKKIYEICSTGFVPYYEIPNQDDDSYNNKKD